MSRQPRIDAPGCIYHIIARGIERRTIFADDQDSQAFVERLETILVDTGTPIYAFCLIPNHFHLLLRRANQPISTVMSRLLTSYAIYFNKRHNRAGHLFQNRYKAIICQEDSYFLELVRYINLNPIRAKLVDTIEGLTAYPFSSHPYIVGRKSAAFFDGAALLSHFSNDRKRAIKSYMDFLEEGLSLKPDLEGGGLKRSLAITNYPRAKQVFDSRILGDSDFVENLQGAEEQQNLDGPTADIKDIISAVCIEYNLTKNQLVGNAKRAAVVKARQDLTLRLNRETELSGSQIAAELKITKSAVSRIMARGRKL